MIQFADFYDDIDFMAALFYNDKLSNTAIYEIANRLIGKTPDDILARIIKNGSANINNRGLFENYLNTIGIKLLDPKRALIAKVFYYVLHNRIDVREGIYFAARKVSIWENTEYVGDDVGIEKLLGTFYYLDDGDISDMANLKPAIKDISERLQQYVHEHLVCTRKPDSTEICFPEHEEHFLKSLGKVIVYWQMLYLLLSRNVDAIEISSISALSSMMPMTGMDDDDFKKCIYLAIQEYMRHGAIPAVSGSDGYGFEETDVWGKNREDIAKNISNRWPPSDSPGERSIFDVGSGLYFVKPDPERKHIKRLGIKADAKA